MYFLQDASCLKQARRHAGAADSSLLPAFEELKANADAALQMGPFSVVHKIAVPPSGNKHDYMSVGSYWWPDPAKPDGLPYIRRDGERNPEIEKSDRGTLEKMAQAATTLALAYALTGEARYADHATLLLRTWFLDPSTRMNPHLKYAQAIAGITEGRGIGIIDTMQLTGIPDAVAMLEGSAAWSADNTIGLKQWFAEYLRWLRESGHGKDEAGEHNNHGTWYDVQVVTYALFTGERQFAREILSTVGENRIAKHISPDGSQPHELARTLSLTYSALNLKGLFGLALLGEHTGVDLWHFETADGRGIRKALDFLVPFADPAVPWPYQQIVEFNLDDLRQLLHIAAVKYGAPEYSTRVEIADEDQNQRFRLLFPAGPNA